MFMEPFKKIEMQEELIKLTQEIHKEIMDFPSRDSDEWMSEMIMVFFNKYNRKNYESKMNAEEFFLQKYGNRITASESWVIRFAEEYAKLKV